MRNSSDIFCLNDELTDGREMFSINGSCPMKLRRRPIPPQNDCFEYGSSQYCNKFEGGDTGMEKNDLGKLDIVPEESLYQEIDEKPQTPMSDYVTDKAVNEYGEAAEMGVDKKISGRQDVSSRHQDYYTHEESDARAAVSYSDVNDRNIDNRSVGGTNYMQNNDDFIPTPLNGYGEVTERSTGGNSSGRNRVDFQKFNDKNVTQASNSSSNITARSVDGRNRGDFHKFNDKKGTQASNSSSMSRNPLTGAGMEIKEHRKCKKGLRNANDKWVW